MSTQFPSLTARAGCPLIICAAAALAEPIQLKLSYVSSDRANSYLVEVKPFVDTVNPARPGNQELPALVREEIANYGKCE